MVVNILLYVIPERDFISILHLNHKRLFHIMVMNVALYVIPEHDFINASEPQVLVSHMVVVNALLYVTPQRDFRNILHLHRKGYMLQDMHCI